MMRDYEQPVDAQAIADYLSKSRYSVYELAKAGKIPGFKVGGEWRFFLSEVHDSLRQPAVVFQQSSRARARR